MTEHQNRAVMLEQELLIRMRTRPGKADCSLADIAPADLEAFRMQSNIHVYDPAFHLLQARHASAVGLKQGDEMPERSHVETDAPPTEKQQWWEKLKSLLGGH